MKRLAGQEVLDGFVVESYEGRTSGSFDVTPDDGRRLAYNDEVLLIMQVHVKAPAYKTDSNGDLKRVHTFEANEVTIVTDGDMWTKVEDIVGVVGTRGQERLFNPLWSVDTETGEVSTEIDPYFGDEALDERDAEIEALKSDPNMQRTEEELVPAHVLERQQARERARVAASEAMDDDGYVATPGADRMPVPRAGSTDPILQKFLQEPVRGR